MERKIANEKEFEESLKKLGDLYEEGKDCLNSLLGAAMGSIFPEDIEKHGRLYQILQQMRDLAAVQMQHKHWLNDN